MAKGKSAKNAAPKSTRGPAVHPGARRKQPNARLRERGGRAPVETEAGEMDAVETEGDETPGATSDVPKIRVRMFRQGLGDCFLLTFDVGRQERHMLIDCGTLGNKTSDVKIANVAQHVLEIIGTGKLDLVVATHEHQDHLSGFNGAMNQLKDKVDHVWLAWTENPDDADAQRYAKNRRDLGEALAVVAQAAPLTDVGKQVRDLLGFAGDTALGAAKFAETVNDAMQFVRKGMGAQTVYHNPGDLIEESWLPGFRFYVLGPPRAKDSLSDLGEHGSSELYSVSAGLRRAALLHLATGLSDEPSNSSMSPDDAAEHELQLPFDLRFNEHGADLKRNQYPAYFEDSEQWRSIEEDWLNVASDLALQMDSMTNNTSLALAIERIADGKVLLFPADSQQGNWLSWHAPEIKWTIPQAAGGTRQVTAADLLARTVFYKVGHHSSHNATAREKGLELMMREDELTAFIPVDRAVALTRNPKDSWQMPARPLYRRLLEKCQGRVARSDIGWAAKPIGAAATSTEKEFTGMATDAEWRTWKTAQDAAGHVQIESLFVEYILD